MHKGHQSFGKSKRGLTNGSLSPDFSEKIRQAFLRVIGAFPGCIGAFLGPIRTNPPHLTATGKSRNCPVFGPFGPIGAFQAKPLFAKPLFGSPRSQAQKSRAFWPRMCVYHTVFPQLISMFGFYISSMKGFVGWPLLWVQDPSDLQCQSVSFDALLLPITTEDATKASLSNPLFNFEFH